MSTDGGHPDIRALADYDGGVLTGDTESAVGAHLASCRTCAARVSALDQTRRDLRVLADPPFPPMLEQRITAALRADHTSPRNAPRRLARWHGATAAFAAAAVVALFVTGIAVFALSGGHSRNTAGRKGSSVPSAAHSLAQTQVQASGRNYTAARLRGDVTALLSERSEGTAGAVGGAQPGSTTNETPAAAPQSNDFAAAAQPYRDPAFLSRCLLALQAGPTALAVDIGFWNGRPAAVVVVPRANHPTQVDVFVVSRSCDPNFYFFARLPRP